MKKLMVIALATLLAVGLASASAFAQGATKKAAMPKAKHAMSCYDYAWDSQGQKDCLAGKKPMTMKKSSAKKSMKKSMPKTT
jgi:uncharacterized membrane protein